MNLITSSLDCHFEFYFDNYPTNNFPYFHKLFWLLICIKNANHFVQKYFHTSKSSSARLE